MGKYEQIKVGSKIYLIPKRSRYAKLLSHHKTKYSSDAEFLQAEQTRQTQEQLVRRINKLRFANKLSDDCVARINAVLDEYE